MTPEDLNRLEELAKAATPGPWAICPETNGQELVAYDPTPWKIRGEIVGVYQYPPNWIPNASFIATANPAAILELITLARQGMGEGTLREQIAEVRKDFDPEDMMRLAVNIRHGVRGMPIALRKAAVSAICGLKCIFDAAAPTTQHKEPDNG